MQRVCRHQLRREAAGGNLLRLNNFATKRRESKEAKFLLRGGKTTENSKRSEASEKPQPVVIHGAIYINYDGGTQYIVLVRLISVITIPLAKCEG